jgi:hypothetical protein
MTSLTVILLSFTAGLSAAGVAIYFLLSGLSYLALRRWHESAIRRER